MKSQDEKIAIMTFASVYPHYVAKIERKGRTKTELHKIISWFTGYDEEMLQSFIVQKITFAEFFRKAQLAKNASMIKGVICGIRVELIENPLTQKVRYLDKIVDELAKGKSVEKIIRL